MCDICYGSQPNCPVCGKDAPKEVECPECGGCGTIYFDSTGKVMDFEDWVKLPVDEQCSEKCTHCDRAGVVEEKD
jgi:hypothetical protein